ncbi:MAG: carbon-nitrogen hydrolase family protein [Pseudomonadales bacterium]|nr:carbon-nitrogen hydrolase family protein [Pseudomonadales bacterium]
MAKPDRPRVSVWQLPDNLSLEHPAWHDLVLRVEHERPDLVVLNEMPFGQWIARRDVFDAAAAMASVAEHERALKALQHLPTAVISSRPIQVKNRLANEAFLIADGNYQVLHHKQYFPQESGFCEETWFAAARRGFDVIEFRGVRIGVLLCTELMFTEWARHYRRQGAHIIVSPRASGPHMRHWDTAARMAAISSGCYTLSSNRVSDPYEPGPHFGGRGFVYAPTGDLLGATSVATPCLSIDLDLSLVARAQRDFPCNVREIPA